MTSQDGNSRMLNHIRIFLHQPVYRLDEILHSLSLIRYTLRNKENDTLVRRLTYEERTLLGLLLQPSAATYEMNVATMIQFLLAPEYLGRNVVLASLMRQERATSTG